VYANHLRHSSTRNWRRTNFRRRPERVIRRNVSSMYHRQ